MANIFAGRWLIYSEIKLSVTVSNYVAEMQERTGDYYEKQVLCSDDTIVYRNNIFEVDNGKCG